jgi:hypothetical protein
MVGLNSAAVGGIVTILMLIGSVGIVIGWWFVIDRRSNRR